MRRSAALCAVVLLLSGCASTKGDPGRPEPVRIVVVGSRFPTSQADIGNRGNWWVKFADHVSVELHVKTSYDLLSLGSVQDAVAAVSKPGPDADRIAEGDIILVTVGGGQALPDPETGIGCTEWFLKAQGPCLREGVGTYGALYDRLSRGSRPSARRRRPCTP